MRFGVRPGFLRLLQPQPPALGAEEAERGPTVSSGKASRNEAPLLSTQDMPAGDPL